MLALHLYGRVARVSTAIHVGATFRQVICSNPLGGSIRVVTHPGWIFMVIRIRTRAGIPMQLQGLQVGTGALTLRACFLHNVFDPNRL